MLQSVIRINLDLGPAFHLSADPDPVPDPDLDPGSQINADRDLGPDQVLSSY